MEACRSSILLSLQQDLEELRSVTCEIQTQTSLLIPLNPNEIGTKENPYTSCLELVLDKLSLVISLFALYITNLEVKPKKVKKPKRLSLAKNIEIIWKRIKTFNNPLPLIATENFDSKETQTNETTLPQCDSCNVAQECITTIITALEKTGFDSITKLTKQQLNVDLFEMTLFGCMKKLCNSITNDINLLILKHIENENELRVNAFQLQELSHNNQLLTKESSDHHLLKEQYQTCRIRNEALHRKNCALSSVQVEVQRLQLEGDELRVVVGNCKRQVEACKALDEKMEAMQREHDVIMEFEQMLREIQEKMLRYEEITTKSSEFITRIGDQCEKIICELDEIINREIFKRSISKKLDIKGDPIEDMIKQIDLNNRHIKELQVENAWLSSVVEKLKKCNSKVK